MRKVPWSPDSWVKIILIGSLALSLTGLTLATIVRAITREEIDSSVIGDLFTQFIGLFGVVVGYVLGNRKDQS